MNSKCSLFLFLLLCLAFFSSFFRASVSIASDTLSPGQSLTGKLTIVSQGGKFELGFFKSGNSTSQNHFIGIWYKKILQQTVVWVANRDNPLPNTSSEFKLLGDGNLVLFSQSKIPVWSSNLTSRGSNSTVAVLLDSGNLVLRDGSNSSNVFWQSFEHPTDTWLPGGRLGLNKVTGENQVLYSWRNLEDPGRGIFSLEIDPNGSSQYYLLWNGSRRYWTSGVWNGQTFSLVPEMTASNRIYNFSYISNDKENYFTYTTINSSLVSRFVMDVSGQIQQLTWLESSQQWILLWSRPSERCETYSLCGPFGFCSQTALPFCKCLQGFTPRYPIDWNLSDWSAGCMRISPLQCQNNASVTGKKDVFFMVRVVHFPGNSEYLGSGSVEECELACLNDCSCTAYAFSSQCSIWYGDLLDLKHLSVDVGDGDPLYIRLAASEVSNSRRKKRSVTIIVGVAGVASVLAMVLALWLWYRRRKMIAASKSIHGLVAFSYRDLQSATKNFSEKLGTGGFGSVYRGILPDSTVIAVKKLEGFRQGEKQFRAEVSTIGTIQHVNLIRLHGFCSKRSKMLLVYDYMPNGSLDFHLFRNEAEILDWRTRYQIVIGTARGLAYLHEECRDCIIHCDIKPENILLDDEFRPKVADFGLAKLVGREFSRVLTTMRGTRGYLAPEWISGQAITTKADVYSFGMMLFEVISGRRNAEETEDGKIVFFPTWAASRMAESEVIGLLDPRLEGNASMEELKRASKVACWCIQDDETQRPSMGQVVQILEGLLDVSIPPMPRILQILTEDQEPVIFSSEFSSGQSSQAKDKLSTSSQSRSTSSTIS